MRVVKVFFLCLLFSSLVFSQKAITSLLEADNVPVLKYKSEINVGGVDEHIIAKKFLDDQNRLLIVTDHNIQLWNVKTAQLIESHPHEITNPDKKARSYVISPDARKIIALDTYNATLGAFLKNPKVPATVYSLETGRQLAVLQTPGKSIRWAVWTPDGKTLVTFNNLSANDKNTQISFWDGETFQLRGSIVDNKWNYLTGDGKKIITTSPIAENSFGYKFKHPDNVNIWDVQTGKLEKTYPFLPIKSLKNVRITDDERYLLAETDNRIIWLDLENGTRKEFSSTGPGSIKDVTLSRDQRFLAAIADERIWVWEIGGNGLPKFTITPDQPVSDKKLTTVLYGFSEDDKSLYVSRLDHKKVLLVFSIPRQFSTEFYNIATKQVDNGPNSFIDRQYSYFSPDKKYVLSRDCSEATVIDLEKQDDLYKFPLGCKSYDVTSSSTDSNGNTTTSTETYYYNDDIIAFHPKSDIALVVKDNTLEIYGTDSHKQRLQFVHPPKPLLKSLFSDTQSTIDTPNFLMLLDNTMDSFAPATDLLPAGFILDGDYVFATSDDSKSIFLWEVDKKLIQ